MDPSQSLLSVKDTMGRSLIVKRQLDASHSFLGDSAVEARSTHTNEQERVDCPQFQPLSSSAVSQIEDWRPKGLRRVKAPPVDSSIDSWHVKTKPQAVQLSAGSVKQEAQEDEQATSTSGRPFEESSTDVLNGLVEDRSYSAWAQIASWRPSGLSPVKAPSRTVPHPAAEIQDQCKRPVPARCKLPADVAEVIASFRPFGLAPIKVQHAADDSCKSSASITPQAPHASDKAPESAFEPPAQAASWRPAGLKPIRVRREALDESENTPTAPKAASAAARRAFAPSETDSPRAPPKASDTEESLSPTIIPDVATWRPAGLSPLHIGSPIEEKESPSPRLHLSPQPSPKSGSPRPRPIRLERDLGPLKILAAEPKSSNASSGHSSPSTPRFKSAAQRKGLSIQSRLKTRDDRDSNADSENTPPGNASPSITPGATTPKSAGPSPLAPSNRQRGGQAARGWEKETKRSGAETAGKEHLASIVQLLSALPSLAALDRSRLQELAASAKFHRCGPGEAAVHQGAPVEHLLLLSRGSLAAWPKGATEPLFRLTEGAALPHRLGSASPQGWSASIVAGEEGAECLLVPLHLVHKTVKATTW